MLGHISKLNSFIDLQLIKCIDIVLLIITNAPHPYKMLLVEELGSGGMGYGNFLYYLFNS